MPVPPVGMVLPTLAAGADASGRRAQIGLSDRLDGRLAVHGAAAAVTGTGQSQLPGTSSGYVGIGLGMPKYRTSCGIGGFECDDPDVGLHLFTGGMVNDIFGVELGYLRMGSAERAGGRTSAQGVNLSAVVRAPLAPFNLFAKAGVTYGRTDVTSNVLSGLPSGRDSGLGGSYGAGVGYDLSTRSGVLLEWQRHSFRLSAPARKRSTCSVWAMSCASDSGRRCTSASRQAWERSARRSRLTSGWHDLAIERRAPESCLEWRRTCRHPSARRTAHAG